MQVGMPAWLMASIACDSTAAKGVFATVSPRHKPVFNVCLPDPKTPKTAKLTLCWYNHTAEVDHLPVLGERKQFRIILSRASMVHRARGGTLSRVLVELGGALMLYEAQIKRTNTIVLQMSCRGLLEDRIVLQ